MEDRAFDGLARAFATGGTRRRLLSLLIGLPLAGLPRGSDVSEAHPGRQDHRHHARHQHHHARTQRREDHRDDAHSEACIPTGQRCPSRKPRGKKGKRLGCNRCCQGIFTTEANGANVCSCIPSGTSCDPQSAAACCSGVCDDGVCGGTTRCPACSGTTPICQGSTCVACSTSAPCPTGQVCLLDGSCQPCDVSCPSGSSAAACGTTLQAAITAGGAHYVCPGTYQGNFNALTSVSLFGAGEGTDAARGTILSAGGAGAVLLIDGAGLVVLQRLHLTGGNTDNAAFGAGISHSGDLLAMTECTVAGNTSEVIGGGLFVNGGSTLDLTRCTLRDNHTSPTGIGGGLFTSGTTTLTDSLIEGNSAGNQGGGGIGIDGGATTLTGATQVQHNEADQGGGIVINAGASLTIAETCRIAFNTATDSATSGGGIFNDDGATATLQGPEPSPIVVNNCQDNCGGSTPVAGCATAPISC